MMGDGAERGASPLVERSSAELVADVERLLDRVDHISAGESKQLAGALVRALVDLYGRGLERIVEEVAARDEDGSLAAAFADDELITHLLLLHGLHPVPLEQRVAGALQSVRPYLESHGGNVELREIRGDAVRIRLQGTCSGCPSSTITLKLAVENAIRKAAPEIEEVLAEDDGAGPEPALLQIELSSALDSGWRTAGALKELGDSGLAVKQVGGEPILFASAAGRYYGYRPLCAACEGSLEDASLTGVELACPECGMRYDVVRAGRCLDSPQLHLEPVPLLEGEDGLVRVGVVSAA